MERKRTKIERLRDKMSERETRFFERSRHNMSKEEARFLKRNQHVDNYMGLFRSHN